MGIYARIVVMMLMMRRGCSILAKKDSAYLCGCGHPKKDWHVIEFNSGLPAKSCKACGCTSVWKREDK